SLLGFNGSAASSSVGNTTPRTSSASYSSLASLSSSSDFEIGSSSSDPKVENQDVQTRFVRAADRDDRDCRYCPRAAEKGCERRDGRHIARTSHRIHGQGPGPGLLYQRR